MTQIEVASVRGGFVAYVPVDSGRRWAQGRTVDEAVGSLVRQAGSALDLKVVILGPVDPPMAEAVGLGREDGK